MHKIKSNQSGFGANIFALGLVILLIIASVGFIVFRASSKDKDTAKSQSNSSEKTHQTLKPGIDETANWRSVTGIGKNFTLKVPPGWELFNYPGGIINGDKITYSADKPAVIHEESQPYAGDQKNFNVVMSDKAYDSPQWQSPNENGKEINSAYSIGTIKGKKYSIEWLESVSGVTKGDRIYQYVFNLPNSKQLSVVYKTSSRTDDVGLIEQVIQTIKVN